MNKHERSEERPQAGRHVKLAADVYDDEISLPQLVRRLWLYRRVIGGGVAGVMMAFGVAVIVAAIRLPADHPGLDLVLGARRRILALARGP